MSEQSEVLTAEQFSQQKYDLPEAGRWTELVQGKVVVLQPPEDLHGTIVLNLSKAFASWVQNSTSSSGYFCYELGIVTRRNPDTVRDPAITYFHSGERFAEADKTVSHAIPALVVEIASSPDRRRSMRTRVEEYRARGIGSIWVIDPQERELHQFRRGQSHRLTQSQTLSEASLLAEFSIPVEDLFKLPDWWK